MNTLPGRSCDNQSLRPLMEAVTEKVQALIHRVDSVLQGRPVVSAACSHIEQEDGK